ncbi:hypothetical protein AB8I88_000192 [Vibrio fluvialis]
MLEKVNKQYEKLDGTIKNLDKSLKFVTQLRASSLDSSSKLLQLISGESKAYTLRTNAISLKLNMPLFIVRIEADCSNVLSKSMRVSYRLSKSNEIKIKSTYCKKDYKSHVAINSYVDELIFSSESGEIHLTSLKVFSLDTRFPEDSGFGLKRIFNGLAISRNRIETLLKEIKYLTETISNYKEELESDRNNFDDYKKGLENQIKEKTTLKDELSDELKILEENVTELRQESATLTAQLNVTRDENLSLKDNSSSLKSTIEQDMITASQLKNEISKLESDKNVFTEDLSGYVRETRFQQLFYGLICGICIAIVAVISFSVFQRAYGLIELINSYHKINVLDIILSRLPFTLAVIAVVTFLTAVIHRSLNKLVSIHEQRLIFLRLSILSRNIVDSSSEGLDLNESDVMKERLKLKLLFLRSHLDKDIDTNSVAIALEDPK